MKTVRIIILWLIVCFACAFAEATSHQLIGEHLLNIGNRWEYQIHITEYPEQGSVDWWGTGVSEIVRHETIEGYDTVLYETTGEIPGVETWWMKSNYYLTSEYLVEVRSEDEDIIRLVRNNNPFEYAPVWVDESDNNHHFGHGEHYGTLKDPYYTWDGYQDSYITFLRTEPITVPAGSFDCVVVFVRSEFHELEGLWGYVEVTVWANPEVGTVKTDEYAWIWDPVEGRASTARGTTELTSFSLVNHDPQLSGGLVSPVSGDTNTDFYWYIDYYDEDGDSPSTKQVYIDGTAYTMSLDSGSAYNGTYRYGPMKLGEGSYEYYFYFEDGYGGSDRLPSSGTSSGPSVTTPIFVVSGRVTDKYTLEPLEDIDVGCWHEDLEEWSETRTDTNGVYELNNVPLGEVEIIAMPESYYARMGACFELTEDINDLDFALPPEARLCGKVLDAETAAPLAGIKVEYWSDRYCVWQNGFTDANGMFTLTNLPPGVAEIKAKPDVNTGYAWNLPWGSNWVWLNEGEDKSNRIIALQKGALVSCYIKDANGDPVSVEYDWGGRMCDGWADTDVNGYYEIRLPLGTYVIGLDLDDEDFTSLHQKVTITDINQAVDVNDITAYNEETGGQISGDVYNPGGYSKTGEFIVLAFEAGTVVDPNTWYTIWPVSEAELAEAGPFTITALPPDANYDVYLCVISETVDEIESLAVRDSALDLPVGANSINLNYDSKGITISGSVENTDANAVLGACVLLTDSTTGGFTGFGDSDPNGEYVIYNVPAGTYTATAIHSKYVNTSTTVQVVNNSVGHWKLNDNQGGANKTVVDSSAVGDDGQVSAANTAAVHTASGNPPYMSGAFTFNGSTDYVEIGTKTFPNDLSISLWFNMDVLPPSPPGSYGLFGLGDTAGDGQGIILYNTGSVYKLFYIVKIDSDNFWYWEYLNYPWVANTWYHLVITQSGPTGTPSLYINGAGLTFDLGGSTGTPTRMTDTLCIGRYGRYNGYYTDGKIDNVMLFNKVLSAQEINALYNGGDGTETFQTAVNVSTIVMPFAGEKEGADLNGDGNVNWSDVAEFTDQWLQCGSLEADFNQDGCVNFIDWARLAENWLWQAIWYHD